MSRNLIVAALIALYLVTSPLPAHAGGVFLDVPMTRVFACQGPDATIEVYIPQSVLTKRDVGKQGLGGTVNGLYALDLTGAQKGKVIEPVRLRSTKDNKAVVMDQFTRKGLKPATIPMAGGTLDFDQRFGSKAKCEPFRTT
ncbi:MAG: hypothetical protein ACO1NY_10700 [Pseudorhodoplanes sp.]